MDLNLINNVTYDYWEEDERMYHKNALDPKREKINHWMYNGKKRPMFRDDRCNEWGTFFSHLYRYVDKYVDKPYNDCYSNFCNEFGKKIIWGTSAKKYFKELFENFDDKPGINQTYHSQRYYIDDEGLIKRCDRCKNKKPIIETGRDLNVYVEVNIKKLITNYKLFNRILNILGTDKCLKMINEGKISHKDYMSLINNNIFQYLGHYDYINNYFTPYSTIYYVEKGNNEYKKLKKELTDKKNKSKREYKKYKKEYWENYDINYQLIG